MPSSSSASPRSVASGASQSQSQSQSQSPTARSSQSPAEDNSKSYYHRSHSHSHSRGSSSGSLSPCNSFGVDQPSPLAQKQGESPSTLLRKQRRQHKSNNNKRQNNGSSSSSSCSAGGAMSVWSALRFVFVGVFIGSTSTFLFSSVYLSPDCAWNANSLSNSNSLSHGHGNELGVLPPVSVIEQPQPQHSKEAKQKDPPTGPEGQKSAVKGATAPQKVAPGTLAAKKQNQNQNQNGPNQQQEMRQQHKQQKERKAQELAASINTTMSTATSTAPFVNLPPPPKLNPDKESFAACLLIKDDNHWLIEWLAYHYFVMPLRRLIVVVDPQSKTSPINILNRYSTRGLMNITVWNDKDFMPTKVTAKASSFDNNTGLMNHRVRQNNFYRQCMPQLRDYKRQQPWLMLVDTDEYVLPSYASGHFRNITTQVPFTEPGSVLRLLKYHEQVIPERRKVPCVYMPRFFFGAKQPRLALQQQDANATQRLNINLTQMVTQRFLYREPRRHFNGKNLISLQNLPSIKVFTSVHHVSSYCPDPEQMRELNQNKHSLFRVHHYLGTEDQYFFRDDPRAYHSSNTTKKKRKQLTHQIRDKTRYRELNRAAYHEDHAAKAWLRGFVKYMGKDTAAELLQGVGLPGIE